jgi:hypothetical protein
VVLILKMIKVDGFMKVSKFCFILNILIGVFLCGTNADAAKSPKLQHYDWIENFSSSVTVGDNPNTLIVEAVNENADIFVNSI